MQYRTLIFSARRCESEGM